MLLSFFLRIKKNQNITSGDSLGVDQLKLNIKKKTKKKHASLRIKKEYH